MGVVNDDVGGSGIEDNVLILVAIVVIIIDGEL